MSLSNNGFVDGKTDVFGGGNTHAFGGGDNGGFSGGHNNGLSGEHVNRGDHGVANFAGDPHGGCYNCGEGGHNKVVCPHPSVLKCRHCHQVGHIARDCTEPGRPPQEFSGACPRCSQQGHRAVDCPQKPPNVCFNCRQEGHTALTCTTARPIDRGDIETMDGDMAWKLIHSNCKTDDIDEIKTAIDMYVKACPYVTYRDLEEAFRREELKVHVIAIENPSMLKTFTNMDLQGNLNRKYQISFRLSDKPLRPREARFWPKDANDNMERLRNAGVPVMRGLQKCSNCEELGHSKNQCPQPARERERVKIMCYNCNEEGHRVRDCPIPRVDKFACKNCLKSGHKASDCPEPANPENVTCRTCEEKGHFSRDCPQGGGGGGGGCRNCGEDGHYAKECPNPRKMTCHNCDGEGHVSRDCPEPRNMAKMQCRNCDEYGHVGRDCTKPRDMARVKCSTCSEMGHWASRCTSAPAAHDAVPQTIPRMAPQTAVDGTVVDASDSWSKPVVDDTPVAAADGWGGGDYTGNGGW